MSNQEDKKFKQFNKNDLHKTGLGSSACVVVSLMTLLFLHSDLDYFSSTEPLKVLDFLCQYANFIAQKKIGSGFDIKTALVGSNCYLKDFIDNSLTQIDFESKNFRS